jgi:hypothetical protein
MKTKLLCLFLMTSCITAKELGRWQTTPNANKRHEVGVWLQNCINNCNTLFCQHECLELSHEWCRNEKLESGCGIDQLYGVRNWRSFNQ